MRLGRFGGAALAALLFTACTAPGDGEAGPRSGPRTLEAPAADADGVLRVLVYHDMEGPTGQSDPNTFRFSRSPSLGCLNGVEW